MTFDPTKPVQTRDGRKARIICTNAKFRQPIIALIITNNGEEELLNYSADGSYYYHKSDESENDLINIPERKVQWTNVYEHGTEERYGNRTAADAFARATRLGVLKLTYEDDDLVSHEYIKIRL